MPKRKLSKRSVWDQQALIDAFAEANVKTSHATRLWSYLVRHPGAAWEDVPNLPKAALQLLNAGFQKFTTEVVNKQVSADGETVKLLVRLQDGMEVESVIMTYDTTTGRGMSDDGSSDTASTSGRGHQRATLCVSSQVGCQMGCTFCATGTMGLKGDLTEGEIVEQLMHANQVMPIRNIVFMGMGEPLNNYPAVKAAVKAMTDPQLFALSRRHVTVSTVGVIPRILQLAEDLPGVSLALSLHAPNQELRSQIVPSARAYKLERLMDAVATYQQRTQQRVFVEYVVLAGVNDGVDHAHELGQLLTGRDVVVNYIPWNPVYSPEGPVFGAPEEGRVRAMQAVLRREYGLPCTVRQEKGQDIAGACGQLVVSQQAGSGSCSTQASRVKDIEDCTPAPGAGGSRAAAALAT